MSTTISKYEINIQLASELIAEALKRRKAQWKGLVEEGKMQREEANHRWACLADMGALIREESPKFYKSQQEIFAETSDWAREEKKRMLDAVLDGTMNRHDMDRYVKVIDQIVDAMWSSKK